MAEDFEKTRKIVQDAAEKLSTTLTAAQNIVAGWNLLPGAPVTAPYAELVDRGIQRVVKSLEDQCSEFEQVLSSATLQLREAATSATREAEAAQNDRQAARESQQQVNAYLQTLTKVMLELAEAKAGNEAVRSERDQLKTQQQTAIEAALAKAHQEIGALEFRLRQSSEVANEQEAQCKARIDDAVKNAAAEHEKELDKVNTQCRIDVEELAQSRESTIRDLKNQHEKALLALSRNTVDDMLKGLASTAENLDASAQRFGTGVQQLDSGMQRFDTGVQQFDAGVQGLDAGVQGLVATSVNLSTLYSDTSALLLRHNGLLQTNQDDLGRASRAGTKLLEIVQQSLIPVATDLANVVNSTITATNNLQSAAESREIQMGTLQDSLKTVGGAHSAYTDSEQRYGVLMQQLEIKETELQQEYADKEADLERRERDLAIKAKKIEAEELQYAADLRNLKQQRQEYEQMKSA